MNTAQNLTSPIVVIVVFSAFALLNILATARCVLAEDTPHNSGQIASTPVLVIQGLHDHLVKPEGAAGLIRRLPTANKTFAIDCSAEHLILEEGQFSDEDLMALSSWIDNQIAHPNRLATETPRTVIMLGASKTLSPSDERAARSLFGRAGCSYSGKPIGKD